MTAALLIADATIPHDERGILPEIAWAALDCPSYVPALWSADVPSLLAWMQAEYQLTAADRVLQKTQFSFDVSVWEFFWPLLTGARSSLRNSLPFRGNSGLSPTRSI